MAAFPRLMRSTPSRHGAVLALAVVLTGCTGRQPAGVVRSSADHRLQPAGQASANAMRGSVYVPVYSSIYHGLGTRGSEQVDLTATVSVRNLSATSPIVLDAVRYHDSTGRRLRDYLDQPGTLPPLASVEFVVERVDRAGGPGASFLVEWSGPPAVDAPLVEAVMLGTVGTTGISFTSRGVPLTAAGPPAEPATAR